MEVFSYFQPIVTMSTKDVYGYESLARGLNRAGNTILPAELFHPNRMEENRIIECIVRKNAFELFAGKSSLKTKLFVNNFPENFLMISDVRRDSHLVKLCEQFDIDPGRVVIEITEKAANRFPEIVSVLREYREIGFEIAIDDWGAEHSNFDRLAMLMPSIVKFDAKFLWRATSSPLIAEIFRSAVSMISKLGISVIAEGIETAEHLYMALEAGCPMAQGYLFGKPAADLPAVRDHRAVLNEAFFHYKNGRMRHLIREKKRIDSRAGKIDAELTDCWKLKPTNGQILARLEELMKRDPDILKAYVLDPFGVQVSPNLVRTNGKVDRDFEVLNRDWSWRPYYLETLVNNKLYENGYTVTGPYVDPCAGAGVFTVSIMLDKHMVCVDFLGEDWS